MGQPISVGLKAFVVHYLTGSSPVCVWYHILTSNWCIPLFYYSVSIGSPNRQGNGPWRLAELGGSKIYSLAIETVRNLLEWTKWPPNIFCDTLWKVQKQKYFLWKNFWNTSIKYTIFQSKPLFRSSLLKIVFTLVYYSKGFDSIDTTRPVQILLFLTHLTTANRKSLSLRCLLMDR